MRLALLALTVAACSGADRGGAGATLDAARRPSEPPPRQVACADGRTRGLTGRGIGPLQVGTPFDSVRQACPVARDSVQLDDEGNPVRVATVVVGRDTVDAVIEEGRVWRIEVGGRGLRAADSLGVGSPVGDLLRRPGVQGFEGEGLLFVTTTAHCGLSFRLAYEIPAGEHRETWTSADLRRLPTGTSVDRVLIVGCPATR
jgi:hypothetical protein